MQQPEPVEQETAEEFYPGFYWKFLVLLIGSRVVDRIEAHLKFHLITIALFAGASVYLCVVLVGNLKAKNFSSVGFILLYLLGTVCIVHSYWLPWNASTFLISGSVCILCSIYFQYLLWKHRVNKLPSVV